MPEYFNAAEEAKFSSTPMNIFHIAPLHLAISVPKH
jgi:hypothetical protein